MNSSTSLLFFTPHHHLALQQAYFTTYQPHDLAVPLHPNGLTILLRHCVKSYSLCGGTGISTSCPSSTTFVLDLGPDLPWVDEPSPGILRHSTVEILTPLSLLMPAFSLVCSPPPLPIWLLPAYSALLPILSLVFPNFGDKF